LRTLALAAITGYKRYLSPHKGFSCAYRNRTGCASCSTLGFRAIRRYGTAGGIRVLRKRLYKCGVTHRRFAERPLRPFRKQRGECDPGCDFSGCDLFGDCDLGSGRSWLRACDFLDCGNACDWSRRDKPREEERDVHIPPVKKT